MAASSGDDAASASARRAFLDERRAGSRDRYDELHSPGYDEAWGDVGSSHLAALETLLAHTRPHGNVLDAACGTGKYWPLILASGRTVVGVDQSAGMLEQARRKHPDVPIARVALHELRFDAAFDAVICVDALENVGPEDQPVVVGRLAAAARPGAPLWLTVELADPDEIHQATEAAKAAGHPVVEGELYDGVGYHFYPSRPSVLEWVRAAGLTLLEESTGEDYWHLVLRREDPS